MPTEAQAHVCFDQPFSADGSHSPNVAKLSKNKDPSLVFVFVVSILFSSFPCVVPVGTSINHRDYVDFGLLLGVGTR